MNWANAGQRLTTILVRRTGPARWRRAGVIVLLVCGIGFVDYHSGIEISLAILYLIPVLLATGWFGAVAGMSTSIGCAVMRVLSDTLIVYPVPLPLYPLWNALASLVISLFVVWLLHSLLTLQRQLEGEVEERTSQLRESVADRRRLERAVLDISARERNAFGRELHDELGQHFVATALAAQVLAQSLDEAHGADKARAIVRWIEEGIAKTRKLARGLLLSHIAPDRLPQELEELAVGASQGGIRCQAHFSGPSIQADPGDCAQLFRIAQEAVSNSLRHSRASLIDILLMSDDQALCVVVEDNGCGLPASREAGEGVGLRIMEHRAKLIGASFSLVSVPGEGTKVICRLPRTPPSRTSS